MKNYTKSKTILLVDDDHEDQEIFKEVVSLIDDSMICEFVDTGEEALKRLKTTERTPDYIFLDLNLPLMTGFECLDRIKKNTDLKTIPVIIYSTSSRESDKVKAKELGATNYLSKANTFSELQLMLTTVVN